MLRSSKARRLAVLLLALASTLGLWLATHRSARPTPPRETPAAVSEAATLERLYTQELLPEAEPHAARASVEPAPPEAPFVGRLIDANTGEAVPWFELVLELATGSRERTTTDGGGLFRSSTPLPPGALRVRFGDDEGSTRGSGPGRTWRAVQHDGTATAQSIPIEIGPTYFVATELPPGYSPSAFRARLYRDPPLFDDDRIENDSPDAPLRAARGTLPHSWVRFREPTGRGGKPLWLELTSADGLWKGGARVPSEEGVQREPVSIDLGTRCALAGQVLDASTGQPAFPELALFRVGEPDPRWGHPRRDEALLFGGLEPGDYRLEVRAAFCRSEPRTFTLTAGTFDLGRILCTPIPDAGSVRLRVRSALELPIDVELVRLTDPPRHPLWHSDSWEALPEGGFESAFEWEEVPAGRYEVAVHSHELGMLHVSLGELEPPLDDLLLTLPTPPPVLRLEVVDADSGTPLSDWSLLVRGERGWDEVDGAPKTLALSAWDGDTSFAVCSPGHRAWITQPADASWPAAAATTVVVRMRRGWSQLFLARRRSRGDPVAGVELLLDGQRVGTTDARGELWAHADAPPTGFSATHPELVLADGEDFEPAATLAWLSFRP